MLQKFEKINSNTSERVNIYSIFSINSEAIGNSENKCFMGTDTDYRTKFK